MKLVNVLSERKVIAAWHMCLLSSLFLILAKYSVPIFHRTEYITYSPLILMSCGLLRQNAVKQSDWMLASSEKKFGILDLTSIVASAHPVSFIVKNIWLGVKIQVYGHFQEMLLLRKILKRHLFI